MELITGIFIVLLFFHLLVFILGIYGGLNCKCKYVHPPDKKKELIKWGLNKIQEGYIIQGFEHYGWAVSFYPSKNRDWYLPKIFDWSYKWTVYYSFKWFNLC